MAQAMGYKTYKAYINSYIWKAKSRIVKEHFKVCAVCGSKHSLNVHHKTYKRLGNEKLRDLVVLCRKHHKKVHELKNLLKQRRKV